MSGIPVVLWDLDSTLCNTAHRQPMVPLIKAKAGPTWEDYSMACTDDTPVEAAAVLVRLLSPVIRQYGVSGRSAAAEQLTRDWLKTHNIPLDELHLRAAGDHTPNEKYKTSVIRQLRSEGMDVVLFVEDWAETAQYIRELTGVPVLVVRGDYAVEGQSNV